VIRVDAHHHLWPDPHPADYPWMSDELAAIRRPFQPADLAAAIAPARIDATVLVQTRASEDETATFLGHAAANPFIAAVVGWTDLTDPGVAEALARLRELPGGDALVGIRHQVQDEPDPDWLLRSDVQRGIAAVGAAGLAYDLLVRTRELPAAAATVRSLPDVRFVLDHLAKPPIAAGGEALVAWADGIRAIAAAPNVVAKVSGLVTEADWEAWTIDDLVVPLRVALGAFGPERLLFGSDWPVCLVAGSYGGVVGATDAALTAAGATAAEAERIFGPNAVRAYRLTAA
jgi:L-fuconolactonase